MNRLSRKLFGQSPIGFASIQIQDSGNPFVSKLYEETRPVLSFWGQEEASEGEDPSTMSDMSRDFDLTDLFSIFNKPRSQQTYWLYALNLWASRRAAHALEDSLRNARERLNYMKLPNQFLEDTTVEKRIEILRDHRDTLSRMGKKMDGNIQQLKMALFGHSSNESSSRKEYKYEADTLLFHLRRLRKEAEEILQANERAIQDCLVDLQIQLNNAQLLESRKSIDQNARMNRLQLLAFIFIPISTVSSIFGANVRGLSDIDVWVFVVAIGLVLAFSLSLAAFRSMQALFSVVEATAFKHAEWPYRDLDTSITRRRSIWRDFKTGRRS